MKNLTEFISEYKGKLTRLTENITAVNLKAIEGSIERAEQIDQQLSVSKYRLVFIGKPGSGKTTTICNFLNLVHEVEVGQQFERIELFDTATGRTTAAEVHFRQDDRTAIVVHPMEITQQRGMIKDYCSYIWCELHPDQKDENEPTAEASQEYERIIRNMLGFDTSDDFMDYVSDTYGCEDFEQFINDTLEKVCIASRTQTEFSFPGEGDVKEWLQKTFSAVNKGKIKNVCIPDRIDVLLNPTDIDFCIPDVFSEVIDTRGYDGNAREDLRDYIDADDTICVIIDEVKSLPGDIQRKILSEWIDKGQNDIINRISMFVNVRGDELADVNEADGDAEVGERCKRSELKRAISSSNLNYRLENTLFVNPYFGLEFKGVKVNNKKRNQMEFFDPSIRQQLRDQITAFLTAIVRHHKEALNDEALELRKDIEQTYQVIATPSKSRLFSDKLSLISTKIAGISEVMQRDIQDSFDGFEDYDRKDSFLYYFRYTVPVRWNSARKTAYMEGYWQNAHIYYEFTEFCERKIKRVCSSKKSIIMDNILLLRECDAPSEDVEAFINSCVTTVAVRYDRMIRSAKEAVNQLCKSCLSHDCWERAQNVPSGTGYYDRLIKELYKSMIKSDLSEQTIDVIKNEVNNFTEDVLQALNSKQDI